MTMRIKRGRGLIYARPSFLEGMARIFDIGGTLNEYDFGPADRERDGAADGRERDVFANFWKGDAEARKADAEAIRSDWQAVGDDLRAVMGRWRYVPHCSACQTEAADELKAKRAKQ